MTASHRWDQWTHLKGLQRIQVSTESLFSCMEFFLWQAANEGFRVHGRCPILDCKKFRQCWAIAEISQLHSVTRHNDLDKWGKHMSLHVRFTTHNWLSPKQNKPFITFSDRGKRAFFSTSCMALTHAQLNSKENMFPCWEHGVEVPGEVGLHTHAQCSSDPVLHISHFFQPRVHTLPNLQSSGNWATKTKQGLWPNTSLANVCEGQKTYVPSSLEISARHIFCAVLDQQHLLP